MLLKLYDSHYNRSGDLILLGCEILDEDKEVAANGGKVLYFSANDVRDEKNVFKTIKPKQ